MKIRNTFSSLLLLLLGIPAIAQWNTNGSRIYYNGGNVGVGTSTPSSKLEVSGGSIKIGDAYFSGSSSSSYANDYAIISTNASYNNGWSFPNSSHRGSLMQLKGQEVRFYTHAGNTSSFSETMVIDAYGNVGIGVATPGNKLDVGGTVKATSFQGSGSSLTNLNASNITTGTLNSSRIPGLSASKITSGTFNSSQIPNLSASKITTGTFSTARIPGLSATHIISGTFSASRIPSLDASKISNGEFHENRIPNGEYMINAVGADGQVWTSNGNGRGYWGNASGGADNMGNHTATQNIDLGNYWLSGDGTNEGIQVDNYGKVSIDVNGTGNISLDVDGYGAIKSGDAYFSSKSGTGTLEDFANIGTNAWYGNNRWNFSGSGALMQVKGSEVHFHTHNGSTFSETMVIDANGNMGIGVATPTGKLDVNGTVKATAFQGNGASLTGLNAGNITTGTLNSSRIPSLSASKITSGTFSTSRIPGLDASKIISGTITESRIPSGEYMIDAAGAAGQVWTSNGAGRGHWTDVSTTGGGDNLGNHAATQNITLGSHWISGDGANEGLQIDATGKLSIGVTGSSIALDADADGAVKMGDAYLSAKSGAGVLEDFANLGTNAWYGNNQWNFSGAGALMQVKGSEVHFHTHNGSAASFSETMVIDAVGNIGIGVATPTSKLDVAGTAKATAFQGNGAAITNINASNIASGTLAEARMTNGNYMIDGAGAAGQVWTSNGAGRGHWTDVSTTGGGDNLGNHAATQNITLGSHWISGDGANEGLQVDATGKLSIGVTGSSIALDADADGAVKMGDAYLSAKSGAGVLEDFANLGTNTWYGNNQWNFSGAGALMQVKGSEVRFYTHNGSTASFGETMVIDATGNIGIGVAVPTNKLEVAGTAKATAFEGNGAALTSLNAGNIASGTLSEARMANGAYMIDGAGVSGQVWTSDGAGRGHWTDVSVTGGGDNLGNHAATQNVIMGNHWLSGDGGSEGLQVDASGKVTLGSAGSIALETGTDGAVKLGDAYLSAKSGAGTLEDFANLGTNTWYGNNQWNFSGAGALMQVKGSEVRFYTHNGSAASFAETMVMDVNGNMGLGVAVPGEKLEVAGAIRIANTTGTTAGTIRWTGTDFEGYDGSAWVSLTSGEGSTTGGNSPWSANGDDIAFTTGRVGIGINTPQHALDVSGTIRACEVEVNNLDGWCDYVFEEDYDLPKLEAVEAYIKTNKHLMDIPSEAEVMANGVSLNDMTKGLLKKVEELTLYMIEKDKENKALRSEMEQLKKEVKNIKQ